MQELHQPEVCLQVSASTRPLVNNTHREDSGKAFTVLTAWAHPICNLTAQQSHKESADMIFIYIDIYYITHHWIGRYNSLLLSNNHSATGLAFFPTVLLLQSKKQIQVYTAKVTSLFPRTNPRPLSCTGTEEATGDGRGVEPLNRIFLYLIGMVT